jgi:hypothetical protein
MERATSGLPMNKKTRAVVVAVAQNLQLMVFTIVRDLVSLYKYILPTCNYLDQCIDELSVFSRKKLI